MIIRTFDGQDYIVSSDQGEKIKAAIMSDQPPEWISIRESMVRTSSISSIKPGGYTAADPEIKRLVEGHNPSPHRIGEVERAGDLLKSNHKKFAIMPANGEQHKDTTQKDSRAGD